MDELKEKIPKYKLLELEIEHLKKLHKLTSGACGNCEEFQNKKSQCCAPIACDFSELSAHALGYTPTPTNHPTLRYMGEKGCVIPPQYRPHCTSYVCASILRDNKYNNEYEKLKEKAISKELSEIMSFIIKNYI